MLSIDIDNNNSSIKVKSGKAKENHETKGTQMHRATHSQVKSDKAKENRETKGT